MKKIIYTFLNRPVTSLMIFFSVLVIGLICFFRIPIELMPHTEYPRLTVSAGWFGASPETVEAYLTSPLESVLSSVKGIKKISSLSSEGSCRIDMEFHPTTNIDFARIEINEKLGSIIEELPYGISAPRLSQYLPKEFKDLQGFLTYTVSANLSANEIRKYAADYLRTPLLSIDGVSDVVIRGGNEREILITIDYDKMRSFNLKSDDVVAAIENAEKIVNAGSIKKGETVYLVKVNNVVNAAEEILEQTVRTFGGNTIRLKDIATVSDDFKEQLNYFRINGKEAVFLDISKEPGKNIMKVADEVYKKIDFLKNNLPPGFKIEKEIDLSLEVRNDINDLFQNALYSFILILVLLILIFKRFYYSIIIISSIVFSLLSAFIFFYIFNLSLNILTIASLILGFGLMVDNSIVVVDYLDRHHSFDNKKRLAVTTKDIFFPVFSSTLTTVSVFIPLIFFTGELKLYFEQFAIAIIITLLSSLFITFTIVPMAFYYVNVKSRVKYSETISLIDNKNRLLYRIYSYVLKKILKWKKLSIVSLILIIGLPVWLLPSKLDFPVVSTLYNYVFDSEFYSEIKKYVNYALGGSLNLFFNHIQKGELFAFGDSDYIIISLKLPNGNTIERINELTKKFENEVLAYRDNFDNLTSNILDEENALIKITFTKEQSASAFPYILKNYLTAYAVRLGGLEVSVYGFGPGFYSGGGSTISFIVKVSGFNYNKMKDIANDFKKIIQRNPRIDNIDIDRSFYRYGDDDIYEIIAKIKRNNLINYDISIEELSKLIANSTSGNLEYNKFRIGNDEVFYSVKYSNFRNIQQEQLENMSFNNAGKNHFKIKDVVEFKESKTLSSIVRENQQYVRFVSFDYKGPYKYGDEYVKSSIAQIKVPEGYSIKQQQFAFMFGQDEEIKIWNILAFSFFLIFMITASLFESIKKPLIIILSIPFALIGVIFLFYFGDYNLDRGAYAGMLLLVGLSVNNSIILVDYLSKTSYKNEFNTIISTSYNRIRPIFTTTFTTIGAMIPLMINVQQSFWKSLALSVSGGLLLSSLFVIFIVPVFYYLLNFPKKKLI
ncbi:MAG: efflux RND transporter permease subunit [Ignavibacterium album]|uniref:efflux RND transporter permease subunit n=1 Tax=Ignavibacterium album TaxID=591197 RepID=UPI0026EE61D5|nr:efflux RND transporter permease subunit [Ignavibacterium album]MBI5660532.1 efflux RND transporter permease subunit [Ignavibacterium album]